MINNQQQVQQIGTVSTTLTNNTWQPLYTSASPNYHNDIAFKLTIKDENNNTEKNYDVRNILLLFEKVLEKSDMKDLLDLNHEELKKIIDREEKIENLLNE